MRLKSRERQVPGGFTYYIPQIPAWRPQQWSSLDSLAQQVLAVRQANPFLTQKHGWSLDMNDIINELDSFNANYQAQLGNMNFVVGDGGSPPIPKMNPPSQEAIKSLAAAGAKVRNLWAGIKIGNAWLDSGQPGVDQELAESRAKTCAACPKNVTGEFDRWFTKPAAEAIRLQLEQLHKREMKTTQDENLKICEACDCVNKLKVWTPMTFIKANMADGVMDKLRMAPACWIVSELATA